MQSSVVVVGTAANNDYLAIGGSDDPHPHHDLATLSHVNAMMKATPRSPLLTGGGIDWRQLNKKVLELFAIVLLTK
jgi:hypothetical protein